MNFHKKFHPEIAIDNFSRFDGTITYFAFVRAAMKRVKARKVMDYGAGRGSESFIYDENNGSLFKRDIRWLFPNCEVGWYRDSSNPPYFFGQSIIYRLMLGVHKLLPNRAATGLCLFIRKPDA